MESSANALTAHRRRQMAFMCGGLHLNELDQQKSKRVQAAATFPAQLRKSLTQKRGTKAKAESWMRCDVKHSPYMRYVVAAVMAC